MQKKQGGAGKAKGEKRSARLLREKRRKQIISAAVIAAACVLLMLCFGLFANKNKGNNMAVSYPQLQGFGTDGVKIAPPAKGEQVAVIHTDFGSVSLRFFPEAAPRAVENFITHAQNGYYNGVIFHRVVQGFVIQGGDPTGTGYGGESVWGVEFKNETDKTLRHFTGALAMANAGPDTNGSQFYIVTGSNDETINALGDPQYAQALTNYNANFTPENFPKDLVDAYKTIGGIPDLDFNYTVFGQVYDGMDTVYKIESVNTDEGDRPLEDVVIRSVTVVTY